MLSSKGVSLRGLSGARAFSAAPSISGNISKMMGYVNGPTPQPPLTKPHGDMPAAVDLPASLPDPVVTELPNGVRIATQETFHQASSIGIFVDAGSRHEGSDFAGATHMLEKMAFQSCQEFSKARIIYEIEMMGANVIANRSRESMIYGADVLREFAGDMTTLLLECITRPQFKGAEVAEQAAHIANVELGALAEDQTNQVFEAFHRAAYGDSTLGLPMYANQLSLGGMSPDLLHDFVESNYTGGRIVLAGASVDHDELVSLATQYLGGLPSGTGTKAAAGKAEYVGGEQLVMDASAPLTHIALGFEAVGYNHPDMLYYHALHMMLGGGASFSAGGPGKGLYSRLYSNVLNQYPWVQNATAFNVQYEDTGFFGILGASAGEQVEHLTSVLCRELETAATTKATDVELGRVKEMLKSSMLMNLESRAIVMEDLGRQILASGKHVSAAELCSQVDAMTADDMMRVARQMLSTEISVVAHGDTKKMPRLDVLKHHFGSLTKELSK
jgi:processing peptidase subunit alpha